MGFNKRMDDVNAKGRGNKSKFSCFIYCIFSFSTLLINISMTNKTKTELDHLVFLHLKHERCYLLLPGMPNFFVVEISLKISFSVSFQNCFVLLPSKD